MKYKIPRNIKIGLSFLGLDLIGWILFIPSVALIIGLAYLSFIFLNAKIAAMILLIGVGFTYYSLQVDPKTGTMNISWIFERIRWIKETKIIEPVWGEEYDKFNSLKIKSVFKKRNRDSKTRNSY
jgi:hypothetical protein